MCKGRRIVKSAKTFGQLKSEYRGTIPDNRQSAAERGYDNKWRKARASYLKHNPLCVHCLAESRTTSASVVDHIKPHKGDKKLFWDVSNWQSLCRYHHNVKTAKEDGGFGHKGRGV